MTERARVGWRDTLVPAVLLALGSAELATLGTTGWVPSIGLEALAALALVFRRSHTALAVPGAALALMAIPLTGTRMEDAATPIFFYVLGIYSLGRYLSARSGLIVLVLTLALVFADFRFDPSDNDWTDLVFILSLAVPPFVFGRISRRLAEQSELLRQQQALIRDQAVREERDRIAREMHDVIAHSVSAMVVQAAAAQDLVRTSPDRALTLLASVTETGRQALAETGRLLHLIRDDADELGLRPAPGLGEVPALVDSLRSGGLQVDADLDVAVEPPGSIDVSAYRVVQEALTNAMKYAGGPVLLSITCDEHLLRISCSNPLGKAAGNGSGLGLAGMAERVALLGGRLERSTSDGVFALAVEIPLEARP